MGTTADDLRRRFLGGAGADAAGPSSGSSAAPSTADDLKARYLGADDSDSLADSISYQESKHNYRAIGPRTKYGHALGRYQVLPENVRKWGREILGREPSDDEYLGSDDLQERIGRGKIRETYKARLALHGDRERAKKETTSFWYTGSFDQGDSDAAPPIGKTPRAYVRDVLAGAESPIALGSTSSAGVTAPTPAAEVPSSDQPPLVAGAARRPRARRLPGGVARPAAPGSLTAPSHAGLTFGGELAQPGAPSHGKLAFRRPPGRGAPNLLGGMVPPSRPFAPPAAAPYMEREGGEFPAAPGGRAFLAPVPNDTRDAQIARMGKASPAAPAHLAEYQARLADIEVRARAFGESLRAPATDQGMAGGVYRGGLSEPEAAQAVEAFRQRELAALSPQGGYGGIAFPGGIRTPPEETPHSVAAEAAQQAAIAREWARTNPSESRRNLARIEYERERAWQNEQRDRAESPPHSFGEFENTLAGTLSSGLRGAGGRVADVFPEAVERDRAVAEAHGQTLEEYRPYTYGSNVGRGVLNLAPGGVRGLTGGFVPAEGLPALANRPLAWIPPVASGLGELGGQLLVPLKGANLLGAGVVERLGLARSAFGPALSTAIAGGAYAGARPFAEGETLGDRLTAMGSSAATFAVMHAISEVLPPEMGRARSAISMPLAAHIVGAATGQPTPEPVFHTDSPLVNRLLEEFKEGVIGYALGQPEPAASQRARRASRTEAPQPAPTPVVSTVPVLRPEHGPVFAAGFEGDAGETRYRPLVRSLRPEIRRDALAPEAPAVGSIVEVVPGAFDPEGSEPTRGRVLRTNGAAAIVQGENGRTARVPVRSLKVVSDESPVPPVEAPAARAHAQEADATGARPGDEIPAAQEVPDAAPRGHEQGGVPLQRPGDGQGGPSREAGTRGQLPQGAGVEGQAPRVGEAGTEEGPRYRVGRATTFFTTRRQRLEGRFVVREADDLVPSHTIGGQPHPRFEAMGGAQPRPREEIGSRQQVAGITNILPELLGEGPYASAGAPVLAPDAVVRDGSGRVIALQTAYDHLHPSRLKYKRWLVENAARFGLDPAAVAAMDKPVLGRELVTEVDPKAFAEDANEPTSAPMSAAALAKRDAGRLTDTILAGLATDEEGRLDSAPARGFVKDFVGKVLGPSEVSAAVRGGGTPTKALMDRMRNAIFARVFGESDTLERLADDPDSNIRRYTTALVQAAPRLATIKSKVASGALPASADIASEVAEAVDLLSKLRKEKQPVDEFLATPDLTGQISPLVRDLVRELDVRSGSAVAIRELLDAYADKAEVVGDQRQAGMFGAPPEPPTKAELLTQAVESANRTRTEREVGEVRADPGRLERAKAAAKTAADEAAARASERARNMPLGAGADPTLVAAQVKDWGIWAAARILEHGLDRAIVARALVKQFGQTVKPHVEAVWDAALEHIRGWLDAGEPSPRFYYSGLEQTVRDRMPAIASPEMIRGLLKRPVGKGEYALPEEAKWVGLERFLEGKDKARRDDLLAHLEKNRVPITETIRRGGDPLEEVTFDLAGHAFVDDLRADPDLDEQFLRDDLFERIRNRVIDEGFPDPGGRHWRSYEWGNRISLPPADAARLENVLNEFEELRVDRNGVEGNAGEDEAKYNSEKYNFPGGENYREILIQYDRPAPPPSRNLMPGQGEERERLIDAQIARGLSPEEGARLAALDSLWASDRLRDQSRRFTGGHFEDDPDTIAHLRANDREAIPPQAKLLEAEQDLKRATQAREAFQDAHPEIDNWLLSAPEKIAPEVRDENSRLVVAEKEARDRAFSARGKSQRSEKEKALHLEEAQSDYAKAAREHGVESPEHAAKVKALEAEYASAQKAFNLIRQQMAEIERQAAERLASTDEMGAPRRPRLSAAAFILGGYRAVPPEHAEAMQDLVVSYRALRDQANLVLSRSAKAEKELAAARRAVPDAPFVSGGWEELAFKRLVREAAEGDYARITWTTGAQQAERWQNALRNSVDRIDWTRPYSGGAESAKAGTVNIQASKGGRQVFGHTIPLEGETEISGTKVTLDALVGRKMADEIRASAEGSGHFEGEGLTIGAKGFHDLYDEKLPKIASRYARRYGAKVEDVKVKAGDDLVTVHSLTVTPEMRRTALQEGLPLFESAPPEPLSGAGRREDVRARADAESAPALIRLAEAERPSDVRESRLSPKEAKARLARVDAGEPVHFGPSVTLVPPKHADLGHELLVDTTAARLVYRLLGRKGEPPGNGFSVPAADVGRILRNAAVPRARGPLTVEEAGILAKLRPVLEHVGAKAGDASLSFVNPATAEDPQTVRQHEQFHGVHLLLERLLPGGERGLDNFPGQALMDFFFSAPKVRAAFVKLHAELVHRGYATSRAAERDPEIARIVAKEKRHEALTTDEQRSLVGAYDANTMGVEAAAFLGERGAAAGLGLTEPEAKLLRAHLARFFAARYGKGAMMRFDPIYSLDPLETVYERANQAEGAAASEVGERDRLSGSRPGDVEGARARAQSDVSARAQGEKGSRGQGAGAEAVEPPSDIRESRRGRFFGKPGTPSLLPPAPPRSASTEAPGAARPGRLELPAVGPVPTSEPVEPTRAKAQALPLPASPAPPPVPPGEVGAMPTEQPKLPGVPRPGRLELPAVGPAPTAEPVEPMRAKAQALPLPAPPAPPGPPPGEVGAMPTEQPKLPGVPRPLSSADTKQTLPERLKLIRLAGLFGVPKAAIQDLIGTTLIVGPGEEASRIVGSISDMLMAHSTGRRTVSRPSATAVYRATKKGVVEGAKDAPRIWRGEGPMRTMRAIGLERDYGGNSIVGWLVNHGFRMREIGDNPTVIYATERGVQEAARVQAIGDKHAGRLAAGESVNARSEKLLKDPVFLASAVPEAYIYAQDVTLKGETKFSKGITDFRKTLGPWADFFISLPMPAERTLTNLLVKSFQYSPVGFVPGAVKLRRGVVAGREARSEYERMAKEQGQEPNVEEGLVAFRSALDSVFSREDQQRLARNAGRASVGTTMWGLGLALGLHALMTGFYDEDTPGDRDRATVEGEQPTSIYNPATDSWVDVSWGGPLLSAAFAGATFGREALQAIEKSHAEVRARRERITESAEERTGEPNAATRMGDLTGNVAALALKGAFTAPATVLQHPAARGVGDVLKAAKNWEGTSQFLGRAASGFVPGIVRDVAQASDVVERDTKGLLAPTMARVPGLRQMLPAKTDELGRTVEQNQWNAVNPFQSRSAGRAASPEARELRATGVILHPPSPVAGETPEEYRERAAYVRAARSSAITQQIHSFDYHSTKDESGKVRPTTPDERRRWLQEEIQRATKDANDAFLERMRAAQGAQP